MLTIRNITCKSIRNTRGIMSSVYIDQQRAKLAIGLAQTARSQAVLASQWLEQLWLESNFNPNRLEKYKHKENKIEGEIHPHTMYFTYIFNILLKLMVL